MGAIAPLFFCLKCIFLATNVVCIYIVDNFLTKFLSKNNVLH